MNKKSKYRRGRHRSKEHLKQVQKSIQPVFPPRADHGMDVYDSSNDYENTDLISLVWKWIKNLFKRRT